MVTDLTATKHLTNLVLRYEMIFVTLSKLGSLGIATMYVFELHDPGSLILGFPMIVLPGFPERGIITLYLSIS